MNASVPVTPRALLLAGLLLAAAGPPTTKGQAPTAEGWAWPSLEACEPWPDPAGRRSGKVARGAAAKRIVTTITDPALTTGIDFVSRNSRYGGIFVDGEPLDVDVPAVTVDVRGRVVLDGGASLAYAALAEGSWARAEARRPEGGESHEPFLTTMWHPIDATDQAVSRLPDLLTTITGVVEVHPKGASGTWYDVGTSAPIPPGAMWDTTPQVFPVIRDPRSALRLAVDRDGRPVMACLAQRWWQGYDDTLGEDAALWTVMRFTTTGSGIPDPIQLLTLGTSPELELEIAAPTGWVSDYDDSASTLWMWRDDEDGLPSIQVRRTEMSDLGLAAIADMSRDQVLDALAQLDAQDVEGAWSDGAASIEMTTLGGADGGLVMPARMLVFHPRFTDIGTHTVVDTIAWAAPYQYLLQMTTAVEDEVPDRYLLDRVLETVRFTVPSRPVGGSPSPDAAPSALPAP